MYVCNICTSTCTYVVYVLSRTKLSISVLEHVWANKVNGEDRQVHLFSTYKCNTVSSHTTPFLAANTDFRDK